MNRAALLAVIVGFAALALANRARASAYGGPAAIWPPDPRAYMPYPQTAYAPPPEAPAEYQEFVDPYEVWGDTQIFSAPQTVEQPSDAADPYELWGAVNIFDAPENPIPGNAYQPVQYTMSNQEQAKRNVLAFLEVIGQAESGGNYNALVGGGTFNDFSNHPALLGWNGWQRPDNGKLSTAAGKYQITLKTWREVQKRAPLPDFSPQSQDAAAIAIMQFPWRQRAFDDVAAGRFDAALLKLANEWESFGLMLAGRYPFTLDEAKRVFAANGGVSSGGTTV